MSSGKVIKCANTIQGYRSSEMKRIVHVAIVYFLLLPFFIPTTFALATSPTPHRPLRYTHVTGQTDWYTCGAAAVSTLLTYYYGDEVSEREVLQRPAGRTNGPFSQKRHAD